MWAARVYGWPPDVVRRQSYRDLLVLTEAHSEYVQHMESERRRV